MTISNQDLSLQTDIDENNKSEIVKFSETIRYN